MWMFLCHSYRWNKQCIPYHCACAWPCQRLPVSSLAWHQQASVYPGWCCYLWSQNHLLMSRKDAPHILGKIMETWRIIFVFIYTFLYFDSGWCIPTHHTFPLGVDKPGACTSWCVQVLLLWYTNPMLMRNSRPRHGVSSPTKLITLISKKLSRIVHLLGSSFFSTVSSLGTISALCFMSCWVSLCLSTKLVSRLVSAWWWASDAGGNVRRNSWSFLV